MQISFSVLFPDFYSLKRLPSIPNPHWGPVNVVHFDTILLPNRGSSDSVVRIGVCPVSGFVFQSFLFLLGPDSERRLGANLHSAWAPKPD